MKFEGEISFLQQLEMWECKIREREGEKKKLQSPFCELFHTRTILKARLHDFEGSSNWLLSLI